MFANGNTKTKIVNSPEVLRRLREHLGRDCPDGTSLCGQCRQSAYNAPSRGPDVGSTDPSLPDDQQKPVCLGEVLNRELLEFGEKNGQKLSLVELQ